MEKLLMLARNTNWGFNTRDTKMFINSGIEMYNYVLPFNKGGKVLTELEGQGDTQIVGFAFMYFAVFTDNKDPKVNSVAGENAYYCLVKSIKAGNMYAAPMLFTLLDSRPETLLDKFASANPMREPEDLETLSPLWDYEVENHKSMCGELIPFVKYYVISLFYDIKNRSLKIPKDVFKGSLSKITTAIVSVENENSYEYAMDIGEEYFNKVFLEIEDTLFNF